MESGGKGGVSNAALQLSHFSGRQVSYSKKSSTEEAQTAPIGKEARGHLAASLWDGFREIEGVSRRSSEAGIEERSN